MFEIDITVSPHHGGAEYNWSSIVITADLGFAELTSSTGYLDAPLRQFNWGASPGVGILFDVPIETTTQEVRPVSTRDSPLQWIAGVCYHDAVSDVFGIVDIDFVGFQSTYLSATPRTSKALSIYGEVSYKIHDQWTVLAGLSRKDDDRVAIKIQDNCDPNVDPIGGVLLLARIGDSDAALDGIWRKVPCDERRARASWHGHAAESLYLSHLVYARPLNGACLCDDRANADRLTARTSNVDPSRTSRLKILARGAILLGALFLQELSADSRKLEYRHGFSLVNEQRYSPDFTHFEYLNPNAPKGGTLVLSTSLDINNFSDEWDNTVAVAPGLTQTYDFLLTRADDELSGYYGSLAEGVAVADDLLSIAFRLRPEARWHDGTPITAQDVKFTYDFAKGTMDGQLFLDWLDSVEVLGQHEVLFKLSTRLTTANLALFGYGRILPAHYWKGRNPSETTMDVPLGSGPYRIAEFQQGRFIRYERVCDYWGKDLPVNRGRFNFDEIRFEVYRDSTMAREGLRKGLFDAFVEGDIGHWASSYNVPSRDKGWLVLAEAANGIFVGPAAVVAFNLRHAPFDDPVVREALALALDYKWLNRVLNHGLYEQPRSYFANSVFASSGLPDSAELSLLEPFRDAVPTRVFTDTFDNPQSLGVGRNRDALRRARELLAKAGWHIREGVLINGEGKPFEIEFLSPEMTQKRILLPYIDALNVLGIDARIRLVESAQLINRRRSYDFDAMIQNFQMMVPPDLMTGYYLHSSAANSPVTGNVAGIADPVVDFLINEGGTATTLAQMVAASRALDRVLLWNFYHVHLNAFSKQRIVHWDKFGRADLGYEAMNQSVFPVGWWYDERKAAQIPGHETTEAYSCAAVQD